MVSCGVWVKTLNVEYLLYHFLHITNEDKIAAAKDRSERCLRRKCMAIFHELCLGIQI